MRPKDKDGLAVIAALREAEAAIGAAMQCAGRTMDTIDTLRVRVDELERELAEERANWQPIETAPKGSFLLCWTTAGCCVILAMLDGVWTDGKAKWFPTHWMPLPAPPAALDRARKGGQ